MKLRRIRTDTGLQLESADAEGNWTALAESTALGGRVFDAAWEQAAADRQLLHSEHLLPFQPLSFRDFMLYEQHNIDAARGLIERFHPGLHRVTALYERVTGRPVPQFKPKPLFYRQPIYYMSNAQTFVPTGTPMPMPSYSRALDFELELGFVLSAPLLDATPAEATAAIGAFVVLNDFSARDVQRAEMTSGLGPQKSKHFASSMSDTAVTADEILPRVDAITGSVAINGSVVSTVCSAGMQHTLGEVLAHASRSEQLLPGELFATGTLPGGSGMETGNWLREGDTLTLRLDGIGEIEHVIGQAGTPA
ncbi:fumarylacetoacetase [Mycobacterium sp. 852013-50091_SCH5140682]|uniref:fumarylacetoacetate hydrolase family protein n=1 Tax=Mycobacterium sp. 852013-50091_SCH5140682 TaxID=1834109 RepID=UPI0007EADD04|nr:fumarylacetoacetate hydrolase family protein [Mycobacterium sp. 852013-50091_SCH5140682]OBC04232.1 fumarylacetoacetase [Mycobacterium sp. 852013-50091_SCH5140682]